MVVVLVVLDEIFKDGFYNEVLEKGNYIRKFIESFNNKVVLKIKGIGLMIGIEINIEFSIIEEKVRKKGLFILIVGKNVLRFLLLLIISYKEIDEVFEILKDILLEIN